ncbi:GNAT family N-acetyltransferase [Actinoplanes sp. NPDC026670]|uniref:GNAT family N-acetyltransferase n=1 Tax=Actinoplanes sp. NPDC026670 TaxID=3154700 RepID=UPI0033E952D5
MTEVTVRQMTPTEFDRWQHDLATDYAGEQVTAGNWPAEGAYERAREETAARLPQGPATDGMLTLIGTVDGEPVGRLWIGLAHPRGVPDCAFLYDIEVAAEHRGRGLGRGLLTAGEAAARDRGAHALELNVFGANPTANDLYRTSGYQAVTQQMRKDLLRTAPRFVPSPAYEQAAFTGDPGGLAGADRRLSVQEAEICLSRAKLAHARFLTGSGDHDEELPLLDRAVALFRQAGDVTGEAEALGWTGIFHQVVRKDDTEAVPFLRQAAERGDPLTRSFALRHLGVAEHRAGHLTAARELLEESTALRREHGFPVGIAANLVGLIYIAAAEGRDTADMITEARALATAAGATSILAEVEEAAQATS